MHLWTSFFQVSIFTGKFRRRCFKHFNRLFISQTSCFDAWKYNWNVEYWHGSQGSQCWSSNYFGLCHKWEISGLRSQWLYSWCFVQVHTQLTTFFRNILSCLNDKLKYGFCKKKLLQYKWTSDQMNTFFLFFQISADQC